MPRYHLHAGRTIYRDGRPIAYIGGVRSIDRHDNLLYAIGSPADLDDFAHAIVAALNRSEGSKQPQEEGNG